MALTASIYLAPPNILLSNINSGWSLLPVNNIGAFGKVEQINFQTSGINVGNVVFYNNADSAAITEENQVVYRTINENKVIFVEACNPTPP